MRLPSVPYHRNCIVSLNLGASNSLRMSTLDACTLCAQLMNNSINLTIQNTLDMIQSGSFVISSKYECLIWQTIPLCDVPMHVPIQLF